MSKILKKFNITREDFLETLLGTVAFGALYAIFYMGIGLPVVKQAMEAGVNNIDILIGVRNTFSLIGLAALVLLTHLAVKQTSENRKAWDYIACVAFQVFGILLFFIVMTIWIAIIA